jgi:hypothetical protein
LSENQETVEEAQQRYLEAAHAMQSGVAMKMNYAPEETGPKHLRVGVNSALVTTQAFAKLLCDKGILTLAEYFSTLADCMEEERDLYAREIRDHFGSENIDLH